MDGRTKILNGAVVVRLLKVAEPRSDRGRDRFEADRFVELAERASVVVFPVYAQARAIRAAAASVGDGSPHRGRAGGERHHPWYGGENYDGEGSSTFGLRQARPALNESCMRNAGLGILAFADLQIGDLSSAGATDSAKTRGCECANQRAEQQIITPLLQGCSAVNGRTAALACSLIWPCPLSRPPTSTTASAFTAIATCGAIKSMSASLRLEPASSAVFQAAFGLFTVSMRD